MNRIRLLIERFFVVCLLLLCGIPVFSQNKVDSPSVPHYKGRLVDAKTKETLSGGTVTLQTLQGELLIGTVSGENGCFELTRPEKLSSSTDSLVLYYGFMGYVTKVLKVPFAASYDVGTVYLSPASQTLKGVTVSAQRNLLKFEKGAYIADIAGTSLASLSTANDVLKRLPLLVGGNGEYEVRGRGKALLFINKREVKNPAEIQNIDASQITSVRIITNPGVSYPIDTKAVIELTLKRNYKDHLGMTAESKLLQRDRLSQFYTLRTNYTKKKLSLMAYLNMSDPKYDPKTDTEYKVHRENKERMYHVAGKSNSNALAYTLATGLNYDFSSSHSVGFYLNGSLSPDQLSSYNNLYTKNKIQIGENLSSVNLNGYGMNGTFYYVGNLHGVNVNFQHFLYQSSYWRNQQLALAKNDYFHMDSKSESFMYDTKLELSSKGFKNGTMTYGLQWTYTRRKDVSSVLEGDIQSNHTLALQHLLSPFFSYDFYYKTLSVSAGLRVEWERRLFPEENSSNTSELYYNPKVGIDYKFSNGLGLAFNWETFISRPQYFVLSGITSMVYPFLYSSGNPHLKSTLYNNFYFNLSYKQLIVQLKAKRIRNGVSVMYTFDNPAEKINKTFTNTPTHWEYGLAAVYQFKPVRFWTVDAYGELGYSSYLFGNTFKRNYFKKPSYYLSVNHVFDLGKGYLLNLYTSYSRILSGIEESLGTGGIAGSVSKFFFHRKLYVSLNIGQYLKKEDIRRTEIDDIRIRQLWDTANKYVGVTLKYVFNTVSAKNKASKGNASEINRF